MLISQLILKEFGKFKDFTADFSPGINLIKGPNEAGKSTLADAVTMALFGVSESESGKISQVMNWGDNKAPILEAVVKVDGHSFKLVRDFDKGTSSIEAKNVEMPGGETTDLNSWLSEKIGISSESVFESTACINQGALDRIDDSIETIKDKLESLATEGKEEQAASSTINKIKARIEFLKGGSGQENNLKTQQEEIAYNIEKLERDINNIKSKRIDLIQLETAYANISEDLKHRSKKLELAEKAAEVVARADEVSAELNRVQIQVESAKEPSKKIEELKTQRSALKRISRDELNEIEQLDSSLGYLKPKCSELEEETQEAKEELNSYKVGGISTFMTTLGFLGTAFCGANYYYPLVPVIMPYLWYSLVGSAGMLLLGITVIISRKQHKTYLSQKFEKSSEKLKTLQEDIEERGENLQTSLKNYLVKSVDELKKNLWQYEELETQLEKETKKYNEIVAGNTLSSLEQRLEELEKEFKIVSGESEGVAEFYLEPPELERQKLTVHEIEERHKDLVKGRTTLVQQIEMTEGGSELLASYKERQDRLKENQERREHEIKILELTAQIIEEARQNVLVSKLEILNKRVSDILDILTGSRYSKVRFDKSTLKFEAWSPDRGDWVDPDKSLSAGTVDQIYFAARLALADLISDERNSILILDDPFGSFDEKRLANAMKVLKNLTDDHQIFLLAGHDHYDKWADSTISL